VNSYTLVVSVYPEKLLLLMFAFFFFVHWLTLILVYLIVYLQPQYHCCFKLTANSTKQPNP